MQQIQNWLFPRLRRLGWKFADAFGFYQRGLIVPWQKIKHFPSYVTLGLPVIAANLRPGAFKYNTISRGDVGAPWVRNEEFPEVAEFLHGYKWLCHQLSLKEDNAVRSLDGLMQHWLDNHRNVHLNFNPTSPFYPAIVARRVINWHDNLSELQERLSEHIYYAALQIHWKQARHLIRTARCCIDPTDRAVAIIGAIYASICLPIACKRAVFEDELNQLINQIILPDGLHYSRNGALTLELFSLLKSLSNAYHLEGLAPSMNLIRACDRMAAALRFLSHKDGSLARFNGTGFINKKLLNACLASSKIKAPSRLPHSGYYRLKQQSMLLLVDSGNTDFTNLPYAHASTGSFELSVSSQLVLVNMGHPLMPIERWNEDWRSTAAHNSLIMDGKNSSELVKGGGVGKRRTASIVRTSQDETGAWISVEHDGYKSNLGFTNKRTLFMDSKGEELRGEEVVIGSNTGEAELFFHFPPNVKVTALHGEGGLLIQLRKIALMLSIAGHDIKLINSVCLSEKIIQRSVSAIVKVQKPKNTDLVIHWSLRLYKGK